MATKKYRFPCSVGVHDPSLDEPERRDEHTGFVLVPKKNGIRFIAPGEFVEMEEAEAKRIHTIVGTWEDFELRRGGVRVAEAQEQAGAKVTVMRAAEVVRI